MSGCCFGFESAPSGPVGPSFITSVSNTNSINLSVALGNLTANLIVDPNPLNVITVSPTGTLVQLSGKNISLFTNDVGYITGNQNITVTGEATGSGTTNIALTLDNTAVISKVLTGLNVIGGSIVATDSILAAFGKAQNQINGLLGGAIYQGVWDASTNSPALASGVGTKGYYYVVNVAGSTNLDGITDWKIGDWAIFNGTTWDKVDNTDAVSSVNGFVGAVNLTTTNIPEGTNLYYTNSRGIGSILTGYVSGPGVVLATDTILQAIQKLDGNISALPSYTFSTGLTNTSGTITNNLSTGIAGGQSIIGGIAASEGITISSTSDATKGVIKLGTTNSEVINIGNASTVGQKLLRVGTGLNIVDIGQVANGPNAGGAIWIGQATPTSTNYALFGGNLAGDTKLNLPVATATSVIAMSVAGINHFTYNPNATRFTWNPVAVAGGGNTPNYRFITPANTNQTASTETIGFSIDMSLAIEHDTGAIALQRDFLVRNRTHNFIGASIISNADTLQIEGAVKGGLNATIIDSNALTIASSVLTNVTNSYGLTVNAQTGATNNYTARFLGGNVGFGVSNPTALGHFAASTANNSSIRIEEGVSPTTPNLGDFWHDSTEKCFVGFIDNAKQYVDTVLFTQTNSVTVANTVVETSILGSGVGTKTLPANFWSVGKTVEITIKGHEGALILATQTFNIYHGVTLIGTTGNQQVNSALTSPELFEITISITCRSIGVTGTLIISALYKYHDGTTAVNPLQCVEFTPMNTTTTVNTTIANTLDVRLQWGAASGTNTLTSTISLIKVFK